jgi:hypothetical protein
MSEYVSSNDWIVDVKTGNVNCCSGYTFKSAAEHGGRLFAGSSGYAEAQAYGKAIHENNDRLSRIEQAVGVNSGSSGNYSASSSDWGILPLIGIIAAIVFVIKFLPQILMIVLLAAFCLACFLVVVNRKYSTKKKAILISISLATLISGLALINYKMVIPRKQADKQKSTAVTTPIQIQKYAYVIADGLNVRSGPSSSYDVVNVLHNNDKILTFPDDSENTDNWVRISFNDIEGFVNKDYLQYNE